MSERGGALPGKSEYRNGGVVMTGALKWALAVAGLAVLVGCSGGTQPSSGAGPLSEDYEGALPVQTQLVVGTLKLEEGEWAVSAEQAEQLIPLWKAVRSLSSSDTAAEAEFAGLLKQIQETMTTDQLEAIAAMQLTQEAIFSTIQQLGIQPGGAAAADGVSGGRPSGGGSAGGFGGEGGGLVIEGGPPGGFQGAVPGEGFVQNLDPDQAATLEAQRGSGGGAGARAGQFLIEPLLEMLEAKAGA